MLQRTSQQALDISAIVRLTVQASIVIGTRVAAPLTVSCGSKRRETFVRYRGRTDVLKPGGRFGERQRPLKIPHYPASHSSQHVERRWPTLLALE